MSRCFVCVVLLAHVVFASESGSFSSSNSVIDVSWSMQDTTITFDITCAISSGWCSVGMSPTAVMAGTDAILLWLNSDAVEVGHTMITGYTLPPSGSGTPVTLDSSSFADGVLSASVTRPLIANGSGYTILRTNQTQFAVWAHGAGSGTYESLQYHSSRGGVMVDFETGASVQADVGKPDEWVTHGWLMFMAWGVCSPLSIILMRFFKVNFPHMLLNVCACILSIAGYATIYDFVSGDHFLSNHAKVGLATFIIGLLPIPVGFAVYQNGGWGKGMAEVQYFVHVFLGYGAAGLGMVSVALGLQLYGDEELETGYLIYVLSGVVLMQFMKKGL